MITALMASEGCDPCFCNAGEIPQPPTVTRIPIRFHPSRPPEFEQEDVILQNGDIVMIKSRDEETFYTGGLLGGAEIPLPRDKDLDVLGAVALAGGQIGSSGSAIMAIAGQGGNRSGGGRGVGRSGGACPPSELLVLRELPCDKQITMKVDLNQALVDRASRIVIKPNDVLILRYTFTEEISNALLGIIQFNFLFNGLRGGGF